ncbi:MAG: paraquat-inducible protein A [Ghiorsea sp.]
MTTIAEEDLVSCPTCAAVNENIDHKNCCYRCLMPIFNYTYFRTERSWAFLITAIIAYIPATLYPMLITRQFGSVNESTIMGGIILLWEQGSYPIAIIIFFASILVPILKFILLLYLLISLEYPRNKDNKSVHRRLHYMTEVIGPWSMIDVFVVTILMVLVSFSNLESIAGTAATAFVISVFFTLLASRSFDKGLIKETE